MKRSKIIVKVLLPVVLMGVVGMLSSVIGLVGISKNQAASEVISGKIIDNVIALDEINMDMQAVMKNIFGYSVAGSNKDLQKEQAADIEYLLYAIDCWMAALAQNKDDFSTESQQAMEDIIAYMPTVREQATQIMSMVDENDIVNARVLANKCTQEWSENVGQAIDVMVAANDAKTTEMKDSQKAVYNNIRLMVCIAILILLVLFVATIIIVLKAVVLPIKKQQTQLEEIITQIKEGRGDLTRRLSVSSNDEIGASSESINEFIETLQKIMAKIISNSKTLDEVVGSVVTEVSESNNSAHDVSAIMEELAATMEEVAATTNNVTQNTENVSNRINGFSSQTKEITAYALDMKQRAEELEKSVRENMEQTTAMINKFMEELEKAIEDSKSVEQVEKLTNEILSISSQTNLLALNASIEAARAGEAGKGFAVVADEIRQLADSSRQTANNIQTINEMVVKSVNGLAGSTQQIVDYINKTVLQDYESFVKVGQQYSEDATHIDNSMEVYSQGIVEITEEIAVMTGAVEGISQAVEESAKGVTSAAESVQSLVQTISGVNDQMDENTQVSQNLKAETENFVTV